MYDSKNDRIIISNIMDNETIYYPLILLRGTIDHNRCNVSCKSNTMYCSVNDDVISQSNMRSSNTNFKILIELKLGENAILINFCCLSLNMKLTYSKRKSTLAVVPMYIINKGHSGKFQAPFAEDNTPESACKRIFTGSKLLQCFIAEKLREEGLGRKTFQLENDHCVVYHSNLNYKSARSMKQEELWAYLGREIMNSRIGNENKKYLGFLSCTKYSGGEKLIESYEDMIKVTAGHIALGGGSLALFGTACLYTWPENINEVIMRFEDNTIVNRHKFMDDSCYRGTYGACFTTTLGSVVHELCHAFDLGHTREGIMNRGFDNINNFFIINKSVLHVKEKSKYLQSTGLLADAATTSDLRKETHLDGTYLTKSCSAILFYHRYFNDNVEHYRGYILKYDRNTKFVKSTLGIRVIEIRKGTIELVDQSWVFSNKILKYSFQIPDDNLNENYTIFVEDNSGNILKQYYQK